MNNQERIFPALDHAMPPVASQPIAPSNNYNPVFSPDASYAANSSAN